MFDLIVIQPFGDHPKGEKITDAESVKAILAGPQAHHVVKIAAQTAPPASAKAAEKPPAATLDAALTPSAPAAPAPATTASA